jgi:hypothetical protein
MISIRNRKSKNVGVAATRTKGRKKGEIFKAQMSNMESMEIRVPNVHI